MTTAAKHAYGSRLYVTDSAGSPMTFTLVEGVTSVKPGGGSTAAIKVTQLDSPGAHEQKIPGMRDTSPVTFAGNWIPTDPGQQRLAALQASRDVTTFRVVAPNDEGSPETTWEYTGFVSGFSVDDLNPNVAMTFKGEITVTEDPA